MLLQKFLVVFILILFFSSLSFSENLYDEYYGYKKISVKNCCFFKVTKIKNRYFFITPNGNIFISIGINHISPTGDYAPQLKFSPYEKNILNIYGTQEKWLSSTMQRLKDWGFNTIGAWSWNGFYKEKIPYTVILNLSMQDWVKGSFPDVFDKTWEAKVNEITKKECAKYKDDKYLLGYFIDNELKWGPDWRGSKSMFSTYLLLPPESAGKKMLVDFLEKKYKKIFKFNEIYKYNLKNFNELLSVPKLKNIQKTDIANFLFLVADKYFQVTTTAIKKYDKNHLILGSRFSSAGVPAEVVKAAARYVDVMSINYYRFGNIENFITDIYGSVLLKNFLEGYYLLSKKPILITEFSFKASDSGLPNTKCAGFPILNTQTQRAEEFEKYVLSAMKKNYIIGYHWFQYNDEPKTGRFDGEDCNLGIVNEEDMPYEVLVNKMKQINKNIYEIILSEKINN